MPGSAMLSCVLAQLQLATLFQSLCLKHDECLRQSRGPCVALVAQGLSLLARLCHSASPVLQEKQLELPVGEGI